MQTNLAVEQNKNIKWSESPWNQSGRIGKALWRRGLPKSQVLSSEWKTERVREDASGDNEDDVCKTSAVVRMWSTTGYCHAEQMTDCSTVGL